MIFGLDIVPVAPPPGPPEAPWDSSQARGLLQYLRDINSPLFGVELGNERNHHGFSPPQQSAAFDVLRTLLGQLWPAPLRPALIGPDADGAGNGLSPSEMIEYLAQFVELQGQNLRAVTHHEYLQVNSTSVLNASYLDRTAEIARAVVAGIRAINANIPIWAGEIGPHTGNSVGNESAGTCGDNRLCGRFGSSLWYADSMSSKARAGYDAYFRQDLVGASYALVNTSIPGQPPPATYVGGFSPSSDYYFLYLWKRLVGRQVLDVRVAGPPTTRAYGFCTLNSASFVTLVLLNLDTASATCLAVPSFVPAGAPLTYYTLTPGDSDSVEAWGVKLNGVLLELSPEGLLPNLSGKQVSSVGGINLPPLSVSLVVAPGEALGACA